MPESPRKFVFTLRETLERHRNPSQAGPMSKYMNNRFEFIGLKRPEFKPLVKPLIKAACFEADEKWLTAAARGLWRLPEREYVYVAVELLFVGRKNLTPGCLPLLKKLIVEKSWWDSVDGIAGQVLSPLVLRFPELRSDMDAWSREDNFWVRRAAILHQLGHKNQTDEARLFEYCARNAHDREFFIRKAIGWALRQYARTNPDAVRKFVEKTPELSGLSRREAMKHL